MKKTALILILFMCSFAPMQAQFVLARGTDAALWARDAGGNWASVGGQLNGAPDACRAGGDVLVVTRGSDNAVWMTRRAGATWSAWSSLGGQITADPSIVCLPDGSARVFVRGADLALWTRAIAADGTWSSLGGQIDGAPDATSSSSGTIDVIARGTDGAVWHIAFTGGAWSSWRSVGGQTATDPAIARMSNDRVEIVVTRSDGTLQHGTLPASGNISLAPLPGGGVLRGSPDATGGFGTLYVAGRGTDDAIWLNTYNGSQWSGWTSQGGRIASDPAVAPPQSGTPVASTPTPAPTPPMAPAPVRRNYELRLIGFNVSRQSVDDLLNRDGWGDEIYMFGHWYEPSADPGVVGGALTGLYGQASTNNVTAGNASAEGGLRTGDNFPDDPTRGPVPGPGAIHFRGELSPGGPGAVIVPSFWEWDNRESMRVEYNQELRNRRDDVVRRSTALFATLRSGDLSNFVRSGSEVGLGEVVRWSGAAGPHDYPFGSVRASGGGMAFTPHVILLTYEVAEHIRRTTFPLVFPGPDGEPLIETTGDPGVFTIRYRDDGDGFAADYTLFYKLRRLE